MTTLQQPLGTAFGVTSTTADVIAGIPLAGKVAVVTGGNSGLGLETARTLARAGVQVHVLDRELGTAQVELASYDADFTRLDLADPDSVDAAADLFLRSGRPIHILVNAAGIMAPPLSRDSRGNERQLSTNHLGHFQLTGRLWPALLEAKRARVVAYSSLGHQFSAVDFGDPNYQHRAYDPMLAYGQSKTANALFAVELDRRGQEHGVRAFAVHPGNIASTGLGTYLAHDDMVAAGLIEPDGTPIVDPERQLKTPEQGAATGVWCATSPDLEGRGGVYCEDCDIAELSTEEGPLDFFKASDAHGVMGYAVDPGEAKRLWDLSEALTGLRYP